MVNPKTKNTLEEKWLDLVIRLGLPGKSMVLAETLANIKALQSEAVS